MAPTMATGYGTLSFPELVTAFATGPKLALGVAIYGNGGLNTSYKQPIQLLGSTRGGVDIDQVFISPTFAYKAGNTTISAQPSILPCSACRRGIAVYRAHLQQSNQGDQ